jgi:hypothetical protein
MISTYTKDFSWKKKDPKFADFEDIFYKSPDFYNKFQQVAKDSEFFSTFISSMQPNVAKLFCE